jgi:hypothetical protein
MGGLQVWGHALEGDCGTQSVPLSQPTTRTSVGEMRPPTWHLYSTKGCLVHLNRKEPSQSLKLLFS